MADCFGCGEDCGVVLLLRVTGVVGAETVTVARVFGSSEDLRMFSRTRAIRTALPCPPPPLYIFAFGLTASICFLEDPKFLNWLFLFALVYLSTSEVEFERLTLELRVELVVVVGNWNKLSCPSFSSSSSSSAPSSSSLISPSGALAGLCMMEGGGLEVLVWILTLCEVFAA